MGRILASIAACLLFVTGAVMFWQGRAQTASLPPAPEPRFAAAASASPAMLQPLGQAPSADPKSKEEKRFARVDKNDDGRISLAELVEPRRKAYAKLDADADGKLGFEEWAVKTIDKYESANGDGNGWLTPAEYASTAPKRKAKPACRC
ncbi:MAG: hypothetical protein M3Q83_04040 [Pseudomonadota bacterium]|nr:hypothetical protein [Pseudomonadota bacterium]